MTNFSEDQSTAAPGGGGPSDPEVVREVVAGLSWALPAGATLEAALRAAAGDCETRLAANTLTRLADRAERGESFESLFQKEANGLPPALIAALRSSGGAETGEDGRVAALAAWTREQSLLDDLRAEIRAALAYPAMVIYLAALILPMMAIVLAPSFQQLIKEFEIKTSAFNRGLDAFAAGGPWILGALVLLPFFLLALRVIGGGVFWRTWCGQLPLIGPLWRWLALAGWARWLALLIDARVPLADGVRLAGSAVGDLRVEAAANRLATRVALGGGIGLAMAAADEWPATATTLVSWGERSQALSASLRALAETCEARARMRARWTRLVAPPFAFLFVGAMVGVAYWTMLSPILQIMRFLA